MSRRHPAGFISAFYDPLKVPNAPTGASATGGDASASVAFTAPSNVGGSAISAYYAVSNPGQITGAATSSPVSVTGLTNGTSYTFTVWALNTYGPSPYSAASGSVVPDLPEIGDPFGGGYFAGYISTTGDGVADYALVVAPKSSGQSYKQWKTSETSTSNTSSVIDGPTNSSAMNNSSHPAAQFCEGLTIGGYSDWYMPAKNELEVCYYDLKPTTEPNSTGTGANANAVPRRNSNYTSGNPAQTSATDFQSGNAQAFVPDEHWSSTQASTAGAWSLNFGFSYMNDLGKSNTFYVRAVRRVAV